MASSFVAVDFETADPERDSACTARAVLVRGTDVVERFVSLIRLPREEFRGPCISKHGIR
ncbi:MAG TPA: hypothetical protein VK081_06405 [Planctomycetota bacterium]|nr:hypothetical protein [Planctomycetota bacterium]